MTKIYSEDTVHLINDEENYKLQLKVGKQPEITLLWSEARIIKDLVTQLFTDAIAEDTRKGGKNI